MFINKAQCMKVDRDYYVQEGKKLSEVEECCNQIYYQSVNTNPTYGGCMLLHFQVWKLFKWRHILAKHDNCCPRL